MYVTCTYRREMKNYVDKIIISFVDGDFRILKCTCSTLKVKCMSQTHTRMKSNVDVLENTNVYFYKIELYRTYFYIYKQSGVQLHGMSYRSS